MRRLAALLKRRRIPHAFTGAMAMAEYGFRRPVLRIELLLTEDGLDRFRNEWNAEQYRAMPKRPRSVRDLKHRLTIDIVMAGESPTAGPAQAVKFPDPTLAASHDTKFSLLPLLRLLELKLAANTSDDLEDVVWMIRCADLGKDLRLLAHRSVRKAHTAAWKRANAAEV